MRFVVAITAASGAIYARLTIERLLASPCVSEIALVCSRHAREVMAHEGVSLPVDTRIREYANDDMFAPPASGSARYDGMAVVPSTVGTVGRVAAGTAQSLIERAADVMLKERRRLVFVVRETRSRRGRCRPPGRPGVRRGGDPARIAVVLCRAAGHRGAVRYGRRPRCSIARGRYTAL